MLLVTGVVDHVRDQREGLIDRCTAFATYLFASADGPLTESNQCA